MPPGPGLCGLLSLFTRLGGGSRRHLRDRLGRFWGLFTLYRFRLVHLTLDFNPLDREKALKVREEGEGYDCH
jgi:hypothetical protein